MQQAFTDAYAPLVDELFHNERATENNVELMLDWLFEYCDNQKVRELYKKVCRTFYKKYPVCIAQYIACYREEYEENE